METSQATSRQEAIAAPQRRHTVVMGRQDFFSTTMRLIGVELYKLRRRLMSKVMIVIAVIAVFLLFQIIALQGPPSLPQSFTTPIFFVTNFAGIILITILAGTIVGGEYSVGTVRLVLTRGPSRIQFLLAKLGTLLVIIAVGILLLALLGIILDVLFILITGIGFDLRFLSGEWLIHALCFTLEAVLGLFVYASLAVCLATLGKNTAAGVAGGLVWWILEGILAVGFSQVALYSQGPTRDFLLAVPTYFIGTNVNSLLQNQDHFLTGGVSGSLGDLHSILVLLIYLILLIGLTWRINEQRDVTN